ncbi:MAG: hypothetical protein V4621_04775 [Pseudomonadota bacterium]
MSLRLTLFSLACATLLSSPVFAAQGLTEGVQMMTNQPHAAHPSVAASLDDTTTPAAPSAAPARASVKWQNYGLITNQAHGALPPNMWDDAEWGAEIRPALTALPKDTVSRLQRSLVRNTLLSQVDVEIMDDIPNDDDYLKLRLEQLLRNGNFEEIVSYYNTIPEAERPAHLYPTAFAAMAGLGRFSVTCLEIKVQGNVIGTASPLPDIQAFCTNLLRATANPTKQTAVKSGMVLSGEMVQAQQMRSPALQQAARQYLDSKQVPAKISLAEFGRMDIVTAQAANLSNRIAYPAVERVEGTLLPLPSSHIALLLAVPPAEDSLRFAVYATALQRGLMPQRDMATQYKILAASRKNKSPDQAPLWEKLLILKHQLGNAAATPAQIAILNKALALFPSAYASYGMLAVSPFIQDITALYPEMDMSGAQSRIVLRLLLAANQTTPIVGQVAQKALGLPAAPIDSEDLMRDLKVVQWGGPDVQGYVAQYLDARKYLSDIGPGKELNYDNIPGLTLSTNYVIPPKDVAKSLISAFNSDNAGKVVVNSTIVLQGKAFADYHPSVIALIVEMYKRVGYEQEAQQLLSEVLADLLALENKKDKGV